MRYEPVPFERFKKEALEDKKVKDAYDMLEVEFENVAKAIGGSQTISAHIEQIEIRQKS